MRIGEILIKANILEAKALDDALQYAGYKQIPLGRALRVLRHVSEDDLTRALDTQNAIKKGLEAWLALIVLKHARDYQCTFADSMQNCPAVKTATLPAGLVETIVGRKPGVRQTLLNIKLPPKAPAIEQKTETFEEVLEMGDTFFLANEIEAAEKAYTKARGMVEDAYGAPPSKVATALFKLANLYFTTDKYADAEPLYKRVHDIQLQVFGRNSPEVMRSLEDLGDLEDIQDRFPSAQKYFEQALNSLFLQKTLDIQSAGRILQKLWSIIRRAGEEPPRARLGELAVDSGLVSPDKLQAALQLGRDSGKPLGSVLRDEQLLDAQAVESLMYAQLLVKQGTLPTPIALRAIKLAATHHLPLKQICEEGKLVTTAIINDEQQKQLVLEQERLLAAEVAHGAESAEVANIAVEIADMHLSRGNKAQAEALYKRSLSILQKVPGTDRLKLATLCDRMAQIYCQHAKYAEALPLLLKSLEHRQAAGKGETIETAKCLWLAAKVELSQVNHATALSFLRSAKSLFDKLTPGNIPKAFLDEMAKCCMETNSLREAEPIFEQLIDIAKRDDKMFEPETAQYMEQLGDIYAESGRADKAQAQYYTSLQIYEREASAQAKAQAVSRKLKSVSA